MKLKDIKPNPNNPRLVKDEKFKKLVKSIEQFPEMMELRPMIVDENNVILGGNMRYKALKELKRTEIPDSWVKRADELTDDQKRQFIIKDNVGFGEHDWDMLANEWDVEELNDWGLDVPFTDDDIEEMSNPNNINTENIFANELDAESNYLVLKFDKDIDWIQAKTIFGLQTETARRANGKEWSKGVGRVLNGAVAINKLRDEN
jgi:ParB-like chromosome segregation protein Spo0J